MKKRILFTLLSAVFLAGLLTHSSISMYYAVSGLELWYSKMLPALLPFMILSGIMIGYHLTEPFCAVLSFLLKPLFRLSPNGCYAVFTGFLCGFPMGAKTVGDLYRSQKLSYEESCYLLCFCNTIGPIYFCGYVLPLLHRRLVFPYLFGMYGIPFCYGILLRRTLYRHLPLMPDNTGESVRETAPALLDVIENAVQSGVSSILSLGGYMVLFNMLNLIPHIVCRRPALLLAPLFEISGGLQLLKHRMPLYSLIALVFGGFSCFAQTGSVLKGCRLREFMPNYLLHKIILSALTLLYYFGWFSLFPSTFLQ